jgi:LysM domain
MDRPTLPTRVLQSGRPARVGLVIGCLLALGLCGWLGNRIWRRIQPAAGLRIEDIPRAVEISPDRILQITRGHLSPEVLLAEVDAARRHAETVTSGPTGTQFPERGPGRPLPKADLSAPDLARSTRRDRIRQALAEDRQSTSGPGGQASQSELATANPDELTAAPHGTPVVEPRPTQNLSDKRHGRGADSDASRTGPQFAMSPETPSRPGSREVDRTDSVASLLLPAASPDDKPDADRVQPAGFFSGDPSGAPGLASPSSPLATHPADSRFLPSFPGFGTVIRPTFSPPPASITESPASARDESPVLATSTDPASATEIQANAPQRETTPEAPASWPRTVESMAGESLWELSARVYGDGRYFAALWAENCGPDQVYGPFAAGRVIRCPSPGELCQKWPEFCAGLGSKDGSQLLNEADVYQTRAGDTLFDIARQELGQASRFVELIELNRAKLSTTTGHLDPLPAGMKLELPDDRQ